MIIFCLLSTSKVNAMRPVRIAQSKVLDFPGLGILVKRVERDAAFLR
jgi:hypothetical protein